MIHPRVVAFFHASKLCRLLQPSHPQHRTLTGSLLSHYLAKATKSKTQPKKNTHHNNNHQKKSTHKTPSPPGATAMMKSTVTSAVRSKALQTCVRRCSTNAASATPLSNTTEAPAAAAAAAPEKKALINFDDAQAAFKSKSIAELALAITVFRMSTMPWLVNNADGLIKAAASVLGERLTNGVIVKRTFFNHFCGGETIDELAPFLGNLRSLGVGAILDYAAEADVPEDEAAAETTELRDHAGVNSARVYDYHGEAECDANAETIITCIRHASSAGQGDAFCAIKITALCKPKVLEHMSQLLMAVRRSWVEGFAQAPNRDSLLTRPLQEVRSVVSCPIAASGVDFETWRAGLHRICPKPPTDEEARTMFDSMKNKDGLVDYIAYTRKVTLDSLSVSFEGAEGTDRPDSDMDPLTKSGALPLLDAVESKLLDNMVKRVNKIAKVAEAEDVNVMVDAEQTYMQVAIDHFATLLQRIYNKERPRFYNTYQCYLTYSKMRILNDLERANREGWKFAGKLVRGAYMVQERAIAQEHSYTSPIFPTIEGTHENFDECVDIILNQMPQNDVGLLIGSHNKESISTTVQTMQDRGIDKVSRCTHTHTHTPAPIPTPTPPHRRTVACTSASSWAWPTS